MKISLTGALLSSGVGGLDIALEEYNRDVMGGGSFRNLRDISRTVVEAGSIIGNMASRKKGMQEATAVAFYSNHPLFLKTVRDAVRNFNFGGGSESPVGETVVVNDEASRESAPASGYGESSTYQSGGRYASEYAEASAIG